ncbi:MAG: ABC transporter permease [Anaerolineae bacterium]|nr:ABC transporter permease [Anaerolineae bacterium]
MKEKTSKLLGILFDNLIWLLVAAGLVIFSSLSKSFRAPNNLISLLYRTSALGLLVLGQSFTMITGNFDLSSESGLGLTAMVAALLMATVENGGLGLELSPFLAIPVMFGVGALIGLVNGFLITRLRMNNLIVTIAMQMILRGLVYIISPGATASFFPKAFNWLGGGSLYKIPLERGFVNIPVATVFVILIFVIAHIITRYTQFGRNMYATGSNVVAAKDAGIDTDKIIRWVYLIDGLCMALAGLLAAGRIDSATPRTGSGMTFPVQAASVIGGISMAGGRGNMIGALGGLMLWSILDNGLSIMKVSPFWIETSRGLILLFAVFLDAIKVRRMHNRSLIESLLHTTIGLKDKTVVKD